MKEENELLISKIFESKNDNDKFLRENRDLKVQINNFDDRIKEKVNNIIQK